MNKSIDFTDKDLTRTQVILDLLPEYNKPSLRISLQILETISDFRKEDERVINDHEALVSMALRSDVVMQHVRDGKKIDAIKELRFLTKSNLREAKDAIQDYRVWSSYAPHPF